MRPSEEYDAAACARERQVAVVHVDVEVFAANAGNLGRDDISLVGFEDIHRRHPTGGARRKAVQSLLDREQIADRIPPDERHEGIVARPGGTSLAGRNPGPRVPDASAGYATIPRS